GGFSTHIVSMRQTVVCCGSHDGRLCQPVPPGKRGETMTATVDGSADSTPVLNDARQVTPSGGTPAYTARQRPRWTMPGRWLRAGRTWSGATKITPSPAACGAMLIVSSVPPATGFSVNAVTVAGGGPGDGAVVLNTNGRA